MKRDLAGSLLTLLVLSGAARAADPPAKTCRAELGAKKASKLVKQCIEVSPATHPPCNDANPCALILGEIKRGCGLLADPKDKKPKFCSEYADKK